MVKKDQEFNVNKYKHTHIPIWFSKNDVNLFENLKRKGMTTKKFSTYVKDLLSNSFDDFNLKLIQNEQVGNNGTS